MSAALVFGGTAPIEAAPQPVRTAPTSDKVVGAPAPRPEKPVITAKPLSAARAEAVRTRAAQADVDLPRPVHGERAVRLLGDDVDEVAALNDMTPDALVDLLLTDSTAWLDGRGAVFFKDVAYRSTDPERAPAAAAPLDQTFALHSKPGSKHTIFLDFDGAAVSASRWHVEVSSAISTVQPAWDPSGNGPAFDSTELTSIQAIWASVAEDYAPFDVDVTTTDPGAAAINRASASDDVYGSHVLVTPDTSASSAICANGCGGVAYLNAFGATYGGGAGNGYGYQQPAWVFPQLLGPNSPKSIAEAASHEAGHQLGLQHDGNGPKVGDDFGYYEGHAAWAPIMGVGYKRPVSQWSKGDYAGANNQEDDVSMLRAALGARFDIAGSSVAQAENFPTAVNHITSRTDVDVYLLGTCTGSFSVSAEPVDSLANLDIKLTLLSATGTPLATADPPSAQTSTSVASGMGASITQPNAAGTYYVAVDGTGNGSASTGYDDYGSMGAYTMSKTGNCNGAFPTGVPSKANSLSATADPLMPHVALSWAAPTTPGAGGAVTGYLLTRSGSDDFVQVPASTTSYTWTGLEYSTGYTFTVTPLNANGAGALSFVSASTSNGTVPPGPLGALTVTWQPVPQSAVVAWTPPASAGSTALQYYAVYINGGLYNTYLPSTTALEFIGFTPGATYTFGVAAVSSSGSGPIATASVTPPLRAGNDNFASRTTLSGVSGTVAGDNLESSAETGEPTPTAARAGAGKASLWYSWTAPASGPATLSTGSTLAGRDTIVDVYTGTALTGLTKVAGNDEPNDGGHLATVTFDAYAGSTYAIAVDGYRTSPTGVGPFSLTWAGTEVGAKSTSVALTVDVTGRSATITATVTAAFGKALGDLDIYEGSTYIYSGYVNSSDSSRSTTRSDLPRGEHTYTARFTPYDPAQFHASASAPTTVTIATTPTVTTLTGSAEAQLVTLTAAVTPQAGTAAGTVEFREGTTLVGTGTVSNGASSVTVVDVTPGDHLYRATFVPADVERYAGSLSSVASVTVPAYAPAKPTTTSLSGVTDGRSASLTATVTAAGATPTGNIQFSDGGTVVGSASLTAGKASLEVGDLTRGTHHFTATFVPSNPIAYESSQSAETALVIAATPTATSLTASLNGRSVTLETSVSPSAEGTVEVRDGATPVGTVALSGGTGQLVVSNVAVGQHHYTATFVPADDLRHAPSTSATQDLSVDPAVTATALGSAISFHRVTLTATVTSAYGAPTGAVTFREGTAVVGTAAVADGTAAVELGDVPTGAHSYTATFSPDDTTDQAGSTSAAHTATVHATPTATELSVSTDGQTVSLHGSVTTVEGALDGTIEFREGDTVVGTESLAAGTADLTITDVAPGVHSYVATFVPSSTAHAASSSPARPVTVRVASGTTLTGTADQRTVTLTARVTAPGAPTGYVVFREGGTSLGLGTLSGGVATLTLSNVTPGSHTYVAEYDGAAGYIGSASPQHTVVVDGIATSTVIQTSVSGRAVTLTATTTASEGPIVGAVVFRDGGTLLDTVTLSSGTVTLSSGTAVLELADAGAGDHSYTATFVPDGPRHLTSTSSARTVSFRAVTTTTVTGSVSGRTVTLTAVVTSDGSAPVGRVTFYDGGSPFQSIVVQDGVAVATVTGALPKAHSYTAAFFPTDQFAQFGSTAPAIVVTVEQVASTTDLRASVSDRTVTLDATVTVASGAVGGSVQFRDNGTYVETVTVADGAARLTLSNVVPGDHAYTATYLPTDSVTYASSVSSSRAVTVARVATTTTLQAAATAQTVTLTATPATSSGTLTGAVEFREGDTLVGTATLRSGSAVLTLTDVSPGAHTYTATFIATGAIHAGSTSAGHSVTVGARTTSTALTATVDVRTVTLSVSVTSGSRRPAGSVVLRDGTTELGTVALEDGLGSLTLSLVAPGRHIYSATFVAADGATYTGSVGYYSVDVAPIVTTTDLSVSTDGQVVTLATLVTSPSGLAAGYVMFREGSTVVGSLPLVAGAALLQLRGVTPGTHTYRATFVPTSPATYAESVSSDATATVDPIPTTTALAATVTLSTVRLEADLGSSAAGTVVFREGDVVLGEVAASNRRAVLTLDDVATGTHTYTATFVPADPATYAGSVSPARTATVKVPTATELSTTAERRTVTLRAEITGVATPAGEVVFREGSDVVGTAAVDSGAAVLTLSDVTPGDHTYRATYTPATPDTVAGSVSAPRTQNVAPIGTTTVLSADADGRTVTLVAGVTGTSGSPAGTVVFREGNDMVGTTSLLAGGATLSLSGVAPGEHDYTATFVPGDAVMFAGSASTVAATTIAPVSTTTGLVATASGRTVTLDAEVGSSYSTAAGEVVFREGTDIVGRTVLAGGIASLELVDVQPGDHDYTATYVPAGAGTHAGSVSTTATVTVAALATTTALETRVEIRVVTLTAQVEAEHGTPSGQVVFREGTEVVGTATVDDDGAAVLELTSVTPGEHFYTATYVPADAVLFSGSVSTARTARVAPIATETELRADVDVRTVTLDARVDAASGDPAGEVVFRDGTEVVATAAVDGGAASAELADVAPGRHTYTATYVPTDDVTFAESVSADRSVLVDPIVTRTDLHATVAVRTVTLEAEVAADSGSPSGLVVFHEGDDEVGTAELEDGTASLALALVGPGRHAYTATYVPDHPVSFAGSGSPERVVTVAPIVTTTALTATSEGREVTLAVEVSGASGQPVGQVQIYEGTTLLDTLELRDGAASLVRTDQQPGDHTYAATFVPRDPTTYAASESGDQSVTVGRYATTTDLGVAVDERTVTLTATVDAEIGTPTGEVTFSDDGYGDLGTAALVDGKATIVVRGVAPGSHSYTAAFLPSNTTHAMSSAERSATISSDLVRTVTTLDAEVDGRAVTLRARVDSSEGPADGYITFWDGDNPFDFAILEAGAAEVSVARERVGTRHYRATYDAPASSILASSASSVQTVEVAGAPTTTELSVTTDGDRVTLSAVVSSSAGLPNGSFSFYEGDTLLDEWNWVDEDGRSEFVVDDVVGGQHAYRAVFVPYVTDFEASEATTAVTVAPTGTTTALTAKRTKRDVVLSAAVGAAIGSPAGVVEFREGALVLATVPVTDGEAATTLAAVATGDHDYVAAFVPANEQRYAASASPAVPLAMTASPTTTDLTVSSARTTVTFEVTVSSPEGQPVGTVQITEDGRLVTAGQLVDGRTAAALTGVAPGQHAYVATFIPADDSFADSASDARSVVVTDVIPAATTTTGLTAATAGRTVTLTATVAASSGEATGVVQFLEDGIVVGGAPVSGGSATLARHGVGAGPHTYQAMFVPANAAAYEASTSSAQQVTVAATTTTTSLTGSLSGTTATLNASVTAGDGLSPLGTVQLLDGSTLVGQVQLVGGSATLAVPAVTVGTHSYRATFVPATADFVGSSSSTVAITVKPAASKTTLTVPKKAKAKSRPTVKVKVGRGSAPAAGKVVLTYGTKKVTLTLKNGQASFKLPKVKKGKLKLTARYQGDPTTAKSVAKASIKVTK